MTGQLSGVTVNVTLDSKNLVSKVETTTDNPVLGDLATETDYPDYADREKIPSDVQFPGHIVQKQGGYPVLDINVNLDGTGNATLFLPTPASVIKAAADGPVPVKVDTQKVADGVYYLTGMHHHMKASRWSLIITLHWLIAHWTTNDLCGRD